MDLKKQTNDWMSELESDIDERAFKTDRSRGFALTSTKAQYVIERLNHTFGLVGYGWRYAHSTATEWTLKGQSIPELVLEVALQYRLADDLNEVAYQYPVIWDRDISGGWKFDASSPAIWSEPVYSFGGKTLAGKGSAPATDVHKSAVTDGLTKAASMLGVAHLAFKGLMDPDNKPPTPEGTTEPAAPARPLTAMTPEQLRKQLKSNSRSTKKPSAKQLEFVRSMLVKGLGATFPDSQDPEMGPDLLDALLGIRSTEELNAGQCGALLNHWLLDKEAGGSELNPQVVPEIAAAIEEFRANKEQETDD